MSIVLKQYKSSLRKQTLHTCKHPEDFNLEKEAFKQEAFWNKIVAEHAKFIRGLLNPAENDLYKVPDTFGNEFDVLTNEAIKAVDGNNGH